MKVLQQLIIAFILVLVATVVSAAGMEPFFKGEWGMSQSDIKALHTGTPTFGITRTTIIVPISINLHLKAANSWRA